MLTFNAVPLWHQIVHYWRNLLKSHSFNSASTVCGFSLIMLVSLNFSPSVLICLKKKKKVDAKVMWFLYMDSWTQHSEQKHCLERQNIVIVPFCRMFLSHVFLLMPQNIAVGTFLVPLEQIPHSQMHVSGNSCRNVLLWFLLRAVNLAWKPMMCCKVIPINTCVITGNELGMDLWVTRKGLCMVIT